MLKSFLQRKVVVTPVDREYAVVGIDPGINGAIAVIQNNLVLSVHDMPVDDGKVDCKELLKLLTSLRDSPDSPKYFVIEQVPATVGMVGNSASQFKLGVNYGKAVACVQAVLMDVADRSMGLISPKKWQYALGLKEYKESIEFVKGNFINPHTCQGPRGGWKDGRTDAVCIAYGAYTIIKKGEGCGK